MYRIGSQNQWISSKYTNKVVKSDFTNNIPKAPGTSTKPENFYQTKVERLVMENIYQKK